MTVLSKKAGRMVVGTCVLLGCIELHAKDFEVRHDYTIQLNPNGVIRGAWKYDVDTRAKSRRAPLDRDRDVGVEQPIFSPFAQTEGVASSSGNTATAEANSQISFLAAGGFHQVDGTAEIANQGQYARASAKSIAAFNVGVIRPNGRIRWSPKWKVDRISRSTRVARDPIDLTLTDLDSGLTQSTRLFDVQTTMGDLGHSTWENGRLQLTGIDGSFSLNMESPYLTTPGGRMRLAYDEFGIVTDSEDTGIFDGLLPMVGQSAVLDLQLGDASGSFDLGYDFAQTGDNFGDNLDLSGELGSDGVTIKTGNGNSVVQDFSIPGGDPRSVLHGTPFQPNGNGQGPGATLLQDPEGDAFDGFLRLTHEVPGEQNAVAFDNASPGRYDRMEASFDFRMTDNGAGGQGGGLSFALLPTQSYGEAGPLPQADMGAEPNLFGAFGVGFDTFNNPEDNCFDCFGDRANHISLHFDGQQLGESRLVDPELDLDFINGQWNTAVLEMEDVGEGALVSLSVIDGTDGSEHSIYQNEFIQGLAFESIRAAFAASTIDAADAHDIDNVFIDFSCSLCSDFNGDFQVDQLDLGIWQGAYGVDDFADSDGDGDSDGHDFLQLQRQFTGQEVVAITSVPEPTSIVMLLVSASIAALRRPRFA